MATIALARLGHSYKAHPEGPQDYALKPFDLTFEDGGAYALLGPSGCGKTTLLNIISGLITPSQGRVSFDGRDVTGLATERRNIAQVFQFPVVYDTMTVYENLAFPLRNRGVASEQVDARVREIAGMLDIAGILGAKAQNLTADLKQKISLGRGLVRPDVAAILFDEPLTVIDPHLKWQLRSQLKQLHSRVSGTMIYVTHDQTEALTFADNVVVMYEGEIVQIGTPQELFARPAHTFVGYFIGSPGMNVLPAAVEGGVARVDGHAVPLARSYGNLPAGARIEIGIRPEDIALGTGTNGGMPAQVLRVDDVGRFRIARVQLGPHAMNVIVPEDAPPLGESVGLTADPACVHVYADGHLVPGEEAS